MNSKSISTGVYQHFKGGQVLVLCCAKHSDTEETLVIYKGLNDGKFYARPLESFCQMVEYNNKQVQRFVLLKDSDKSLVSFDKVNNINRLLND